MKKLVFLILPVLALALLAGCGWFRPEASTVSVRLRCGGSHTDSNWRVVLNSGTPVSTNSATGGAAVFDDVEDGQHTLWFFMPYDCYDNVVAYRNITVSGKDVDFAFDLDDLDIF